MLVDNAVRNIHNLIATSQLIPPGSTKFWPTIALVTWTKLLYVEPS